jgi:hypothetical protein
MPTMYPSESKPNCLPIKDVIPALEESSFNNSFASFSLMIYSFPFADLSD